MIPIRCGRIVESEEEYDVLRRESKRGANVNCTVFLLLMLVFMIASVVVLTVMGDSYELFHAYYIMYIVGSIISMAMMLAHILSEYNKKDHVESGVVRYVMNRPACITLIILSAFIGVMFLGMFSISLEYWTAAWNLPVPIFVCLFSLASAVFDLILLVYAILWMIRWSKPWNKLSGIGSPEISESPKGKDITADAVSDARNGSVDIHALEEYLKLLHDMYAEGLLDDGEYTEAKRQAILHSGRI